MFAATVDRTAPHRSQCTQRAHSLTHSLLRRRLNSPQIFAAATRPSKINYYNLTAYTAYKRVTLYLCVFCGVASCMAFSLPNNSNLSFFKRVWELAYRFTVWYFWLFRINLAVKSEISTDILKW